MNCSGQRLADGMVWQIEDLDEGDYQLELRATTPAESVALPHVQISVVKNLKPRLEKVDQWLQEARSNAQRDDASEMMPSEMMPSEMMFRKRFACPLVKSSESCAHKAISARWRRTIRRFACSALPSRSSTRLRKHQISLARQLPAVFG